MLLDGNLRLGGVLLPLLVGEALLAFELPDDGLLAGDLPLPPGGMVLLLPGVFRPGLGLPFLGGMFPPI